MWQSVLASVQTFALLIMLLGIYSVNTLPRGTVVHVQGSVGCNSKLLQTTHEVISRDRLNI